MIDLHCHVLPGIDDGPETIADSLALARAALATGTDTLVATSHVSYRYRNTAATIAGLVTSVNEALRLADVALDVLPGAEIAATLLPDIEADELRALVLGGGPWLLVEPPFTPSAIGLDAALLRVLRGEHRVVLAHPERCPAFHRDPAMLESLVRAGVLTSVTAGSLVGRFGKEARRFSMWMAESEMIHNVASDAHGTEGRPPGIAQELAQAGLEPLKEWLTEAVPRAVLSGADAAPPRPAQAVPEPRARRGSSRWKEMLSLKRAS